jgi:hypothetical protein
MGKLLDIDHVNALHSEYTTSLVMEMTTRRTSLEKNEAHSSPASSLTTISSSSTAGNIYVGQQRSDTKSFVHKADMEESLQLQGALLIFLLINEIKYIPIAKCVGL